MPWEGVPLPAGHIAFDIAVAPEGNVYVIAGGLLGNRGGLYMWQGGANWLNTGQTLGAPRIAGAPEGGVYFIGSVVGGIHWWKPNGGHQGGATNVKKEHVLDITAGTDGHPWIASKHDPLILNTISRWNGHAFDPVIRGNNFERVASRNDQIWYTRSFDNGSGDRNNTGWRGTNGSGGSGNAYARDLAAGPEGEIWHIGRGNEGQGGAIYRLNEEGWMHIPDGTAYALAVGPNRDCWVIGEGAQLWRLR